MTDPDKRAVCIGEAIVELARGADGRFALASSGDTFNTAIYLARAGVPVALASALGDDPFSDAIVSLAQAEGIGTDLILRAAGRLPGLALVDADGKGERCVHYWREAAPARELFELPQWSGMAKGLVNARLIYFTGITLSLYSNVGLGRFSRHSNSRAAMAPRSLSTEVSARAAGAAISRAPAPYSRRRSSASTSRCRTMTTRRCCGAILRPRRPLSGCRPSAWLKSS